MSRIGKQPIEIPEGVTANIDGASITVKGPKGELALTVADDVKVAMNDNEITIEPVKKNKRGRQQWGLHRTLVSNLIEGVTRGFERKLEVNGVGYRAQMRGKDLNLQLGYSHEINFPVPEGIQIQTPDQGTIVISGINKQLVGEVAANIRAFRSPEPYKGKGVKYAGEYIFRKEGKKK